MEELEGSTLEAQLLAASGCSSLKKLAGCLREKAGDVYAQVRGKTRPRAGLFTKIQDRFSLPQGTVEAMEELRRSWGEAPSKSPAPPPPRRLALTTEVMEACGVSSLAALGAALDCGENYLTEVFSGRKAMSASLLRSFRRSFPQMNAAVIEKLEERLRLDETKKKRGKERGSPLKRWLAEHRLTHVSALATEAGINPARLCNVVAGRYPVSADIEEKLRQRFAAETEALIAAIREEQRGKVSLRLIIRNASEPLTAAELGRITGYSEASFERLFEGRQKMRAPFWVRLRRRIGGVVFEYEWIYK